MKNCLFRTLALVLVSAVFMTSGFAYDELNIGSKGNGVVQLQQALIDQGYLNGKADGDYGRMTAAAVSSFQKDNGLPETGIADEATQEILFGDTTDNADVGSAASSTESESSQVFSIRNGISFRSSAQEIFDIETSNGEDPYLNSNEFALRVSCYDVDVEGINCHIVYEFDRESEQLSYIDYSFDDDMSITDPDVSSQQIRSIVDLYTERYGGPLYSENGLDYEYPTLYLQEFLDSDVFEILECYEWSVDDLDNTVVIDAFRMRYIEENTYSLSVSFSQIPATDSDVATESESAPEALSKSRHLYDNAQILTIPTGGEYSLIYAPKADVTMEALVDWYYNYVEKHDYNWCMILYTDSNSNEGVYGMYGLVEVGDTFKKDPKSWGIEDSSNAVLYIPDESGLVPID